MFDILENLAYLFILSGSLDILISKAGVHMWNFLSRIKEKSHKLCEHWHILFLFTLFTIDDAALFFMLYEVTLVNMEIINDCCMTCFK